MAKSADAGELRTRVYFRRVRKSVDPEGCSDRLEEPVFVREGKELPVHCKWVNAHGSEVFVAMQLSIRESATLTMRYSPLVDASQLVYRLGDPRPYEILSVDNVEQRGRWLEVKVKRKGAAR